MKNYVQSGEIITVTAPADCKSGDPVIDLPA
jgi:predicted RecA/RadA family phage recombinase